MATYEVDALEKVNCKNYLNGDVFYTPKGSVGIQIKGEIRKIIGDVRQTKGGKK